MTPQIESEEQLYAADCLRDERVCGFGLTDPGSTRFAKAGAHDPTPTPYFVLEELFQEFDFRWDSHLLDVGCGTGRVLAYFKEAGFEGRATGVELDPDLAAVAQRWTARYDNLDAVNGDVLDLSLGDYTHFYLFNPFDTAVLLKFLGALEAQATRKITLVHMSDNGETYFYMGRTGWSLVKQGSFQKYRNQRGRLIDIYGCPQTFSVWTFDPTA